MLIATKNILYQNRMYAPGDRLPTYDAAMVEAWLESDSAIDKTDNMAGATKASAVSVESLKTDDKPAVKKPSTAARKKK